ncbi:alpha/beta fold hydrolase [Pseudalkalibacillus caeni]|uniref:Alpha/beta hydrolase n=1 Tax=Exobacillus caeni TaxID=2574798 RepID=A0A5R9FBQ5_9BACL|nr:alpha/beta hydrolase [Pseudalkalibacillus caeni]TLS38313.1 alpha/beta hydrolase [Pseudalkalibacillus caeni]
MKERLLLHNVRAFEWNDGAEDKPLLICLHGLTNNALGFIEIGEALKDRFRVVSLDLPGHGKTPSFEKENEYGFPEIAKWLDGVVNELTQKPFYLAGHSWGAGIALHYAFLYPENVKGIVMIDGGFIQPGDDPDASLEEDLKGMKDWVEGSRFPEIEPYLEKKKEEIGRWSEALELMAREDMQHSLNGIEMRTSVATAQSIMKAFYQDSFRALYKDIETPVLLLVATLPEEFEGMRKLAIKDMSGKLQGSFDCVPVKETGHVLHWQKPEETVEYMSEWLTRQEKNYKQETF